MAETKKKPSKTRYVSEGHEAKNKALRAARHKKHLARLAKRRAKRKEEGYVLPSKIKRFEKRSKKAKKAKAAETATPEVVATLAN